MPKEAHDTVGFRIIVTLLTAMVSSGVYGQSETNFESEFAQSWLIHTADAGDILVVPFAQGLANPFDLAFRDNGDILVTERYTGQLRVIREGVLLPDAVSGVPDVYSEVFRAGLMSVALHPDNDALVFLSYTKPIVVDDEPEQTVALARGILDGEQLVNVEEIFVAQGLDRGIAAAKLLFAPDGHLLMSIGGAYMYMGLGIMLRIRRYTMANCCASTAMGLPQQTIRFWNRVNFFLKCIQSGIAIRSVWISIRKRESCGLLKTVLRAVMKSTSSGLVRTMVGLRFLTAGSIVATGLANGNGRATLFSQKSSGGRQLRRRVWLSTQGIK